MFTDSSEDEEQPYVDELEEGLDYTRADDDEQLLQEVLDLDGVPILDLQQIYGEGGRRRTGDLRHYIFRVPHLFVDYASRPESLLDYSNYIKDSLQVTLNATTSTGADPAALRYQVVVTGYMVQAADEKEDNANHEAIEEGKNPGPPFTVASGFFRAPVLYNILSPAEIGPSFDIGLWEKLLMVMTSATSVVVSEIIVTTLNPDMGVDAGYYYEPEENDDELFEGGSLRLTAFSKKHNKALWLLRPAHVVKSAELDNYCLPRAILFQYLIAHLRNPREMKKKTPFLWDHFGFEDDPRIPTLNRLVKLCSRLTGDKDNRFLRKFNNRYPPNEELKETPVTIASCGRYKMWKGRTFANLMEDFYMEFALLAGVASSEEELAEKNGVFNLGEGKAFAKALKFRTLNYVVLNSEELKNCSKLLEKMEESEVLNEDAVLTCDLIFDQGPSKHWDAVCSWKQLGLTGEGEWDCPVHRRFFRDRQRHLYSADAREGKCCKRCLGRDHIFPKNGDCGSSGTECVDCKLTFLNIACYMTHIKNDVCKRVRFCDLETCKCVYTTWTRKALLQLEEREGLHDCSTRRNCASCRTKNISLDHTCSIQPLKQPGKETYFIGADTETTPMYHEHCSVLFCPNEAAWSLESGELKCEAHITPEELKGEATEKLPKKLCCKCKEYRAFYSKQVRSLRYISKPTHCDTHKEHAQAEAKHKPISRTSPVCRVLGCHQAAVWIPASPVIITPKVAELCAYCIPPTETGKWKLSHEMNPHVVTRWNAVDRFGEVIFNTSNFEEGMMDLVRLSDGGKNDVVVLLHNLSGFDGTFIMRFFQASLLLNGSKEKRIMPATVMAGRKFIQIRYGKLVFRDTMRFMATSLKNFNKAFGLDSTNYAVSRVIWGDDYKEGATGSKGFFPHDLGRAFFETGRIAPKHMFGHQVKEKGFDEWYKTHDFKSGYTKLEADYCLNDTRVLVAAAEVFTRNMAKMLGVLVPIQRHYNTTTPAIKETLKSYRLNIKRLQTQLRRTKITPDEWADLKYEESQYQDKLEAYRKSQERRKARQNRRAYWVSRYIQKDGMTPAEAHKQVDAEMDEGLDYLEVPEGAEEFDEIPPSQHVVEPFAFPTIASYCSAVMRTYFDMSFMELDTPREGANPYERWVHYSFLRDGVRGGRTELFRYYAQAGEETEIHYVDIMSLYPWVLKACRFPTSRRKEYIPEDRNHSLPESIHFLLHASPERISYLEVDVLPPRDLRIPLLPAVINGKLSFTLDPLVKQKLSCFELRKALELGYKITKVYKALYWDKSRVGVFKDFVDTFLRWKLAYSYKGGDKDEYCRLVLENEGITLNPEDLSYNESMRGSCKLILNSSWGKWAQRVFDRLGVEYFPEFEDELDQLQRDRWKEIITACEQGRLEEVQVTSMLAAGPEYDKLQVPMQYAKNQTIKAFKSESSSPHLMQISYKTRATNAEVKPLKNASLIYALLTTSHARLRLYEHMEMLDAEQLLYCDTDSIIYQTKKEGGKRIPTDKCKLGAMESELCGCPGSTIDEFWGVAPKCYMYTSRCDNKSCKKSGGVVKKAKGVRAGPTGHDFTGEDMISMVEKGTHRYYEQMNFKIESRAHPSLRKMTFFKKLGANLDKRYFFSDEKCYAQSLPWGHKDIPSLDAKRRFESLQATEAVTTPKLLQAKLKDLVTSHGLKPPTSLDYKTDRPKFTGLLKKNHPETWSNLQHWGKLRALQSQLHELFPEVSQPRLQDPMKITSLMVTQLEDYIQETLTRIYSPQAEEEKTAVSTRKKKRRQAKSNPKPAKRQRLRIIKKKKKKKKKQKHPRSHSSSPPTPPPEKKICLN